MERNRALFYKLIRCHCGSGMKKIMERQHPAYVCSQYANYRRCQRTIVKEETLLTFFDKYCLINKIGEIEHTYENINRYIKEILLDSNLNLSIYYRDGYVQRLTNNLLKY